MTQESKELTAFSKSEQQLRELVPRLVLDHEALSRPLKPCDLATCHGTCCYDGVYLWSDEAKVVRELSEDSRDHLASYGLDLPKQVIVFGRDGDISGPKTATKSIPMSELATSYPAHFPNTACIFLDAKARCGLQRLAVDRGKSPWFYKPFTCWLHPLSITDEGFLTLQDDETDAQNRPDYPGFVSQTHCGRQTNCGGDPAYEVLSAEIEMLGRIGARDILSELRLQSTKTSPDSA